LDIKQEDLIRFWLHFGFRMVSGGNWCESPDRIGYIRKLPQPDLNNLYRYAIPKLQKEGKIVRLTAFECSGFSAEITSVSDNFPLIKHSVSDSPTEALYTAILKVIDNEASK